MAITTSQPISYPATAAPVDQAQVRQYTRRQIAAVWAAAALPMGLLSWLIAPWLAGRLDGPHQLAKALMLCLTAGLVWQFVLVVVLVAREQQSLRWSRVRQALWLTAPRSARSGRRGGRAWLIVVPLIVAFGAVHELLPVLPQPEGRDMGAFLGSETGQEFLSGAWAWLAVIAALQVFNSVLGEELLFRGLLLPRMNGAFGERDWLANGVMFGAYHLHVPWAIPGALLDTFIIAGPSKRYRSALIGIIVHSSQSVVILGLALALVLR